jgi:hypothetical protein
LGLYAGLGWSERVRSDDLSVASSRQAAGILTGIGCTGQLKGKMVKVYATQLSAKSIRRRRNDVVCLSSGSLPLPHGALDNLQ